MSMPPSGMGVPGSGLPACERNGNADGGAPRAGRSDATMGVDGDGEARGVSNGFGTAAAALGDPCDRDAERDWECECPWEYCEDEDVGEAGTAGTAGTVTTASDERLRWWLRGRMAAAAAPALAPVPVPVPVPVVCACAWC